MVAIEHTRKPVQDFLAPELRTISAQLDALEAKVDDHHREVMTAVANLANYQAVIQRLAKLEAKEAMRQ